MDELSRHEENVNAATHGFGLLLSLLATAIIISATRATSTIVAIGCVAYAMTLIIVYAASTISHLVDHLPRKQLLRAWDQGVIYLLIAGTYTPFACFYLSSRMRGLVLGGMWLAAIAGFVSKVIYKYRVIDFKPHTYILLGWLPALTLMHLLPTACTVWMVIGGLLYTIGTIFLLLDKRVTYFHATWHLFVIAASACHFYGIMNYVVAVA